MLKALIIGYVWPEPKTTAAGHRMMQLVSAFKNEGFAITFATTASKTKYSENLEECGILTKVILLNNSSFDDFVKELKPDVVVFDRFMVEEQFGWRVAEHVPNALRILNTEDLHSLRNTRELALKKDEEFTINRWLGDDMTKREIASIYRSDLTLLVSLFEKKLLIDVLNISPDLLYHLPFLLETISIKTQEELRTFEERKDFICFGNGKHAPNLDAFIYLKEVIWPLIRKELPNAEVHIYGAYLPQQVEEMHKPKDGFCIHGWINDLDTALQKTRINLAPLRFGAGIKGKLTQAMQNGTPTVSTTIGVEGMFSEGSRPVAVADHPKEFVRAVVTLYNDESKWTDIQSNGIKTINSFYKKKTLVPIFFDQLEKLLKNLMEHRTANFIGSLLQHQTMAGTKYMSKWIAEKNSKK